MLAVKVDYETGLATVGTDADVEASTGDILKAIESLGYQGQLLRTPP